LRSGPDSENLKKYRRMPMLNCSICRSVKRSAARDLPVLITPTALLILGGM
jgi:hypothetical protein